MFEFCTQLGKKEVNALNAFHVFIKRPWMMPFFMVVFGGYFTYCFITEADYVYLGMAIVFGLGFPLLCFLMMKVMVWMYLRSSPMISEKNNITFTATPDAMVYRTEMPDMTSTTTMKWNLLHRAYETKTHFFLYISNMQSYVLPKNDITTGTIEEFKGVLKGKLAKKYKKRYF